jgi:hypothetical protein
MATNHVFISELDYFLPMEVWAKKNLSEEEFKEFETNMSDENFDLVNYVYENWIVDQKLTHTYTNIYDEPVTVSYKSFNAF